MNKVIYFVRHGHYIVPPRKSDDLSEKDGHLSLMGIEDIVEVAHKIKKLDSTIKHIYASPFQRIRETAKLLKRLLHLPVLIREELHEQHTGDNTINHFQNIFEEFSTVVIEAFEVDHGNSIIVSHDLPINLFIAISSGISYELPVAYATGFLG